MNNYTIAIVLLSVALAFALWNWIVAACRAIGRKWEIADLKNIAEARRSIINSMCDTLQSLMRAHEAECELLREQPRLFLIKNTAPGEKPGHYVGRGHMGKCEGCGENFIDLVFGRVPPGVEFDDKGHLQDLHKDERFHDESPQIVLRIHGGESGRKFLNYVTQVVTELEKTDAPETTAAPKDELATPSAQD